MPPAARRVAAHRRARGKHAPLTIRQRVVVFDTHLEAGDQVVPPAVTGMTSWVYVMNGAIVAGDERLEKGDAGVPLSLEPKRTSGFGCPQEFFRRIGIAKRPEVAPQNGIRDGEVIASKHVEMLVC